MTVRVIVIHIPLHLVCIDFHDDRDNLYIYNLREKPVSQIENIKIVCINYLYIHPWYPDDIVIKF